MLKWMIVFYRFVFYMNEMRFIVSLNAQLINRVFSQRLSRTLPSVSVRGPPRRTYCLLDTASILFGLTIRTPEGSWLKKKLPGMKLEKQKEKRRVMRKRDGSGARRAE